MKRWNWRRALMGWINGALVPCVAFLAASGELKAQGPRDGESQTVSGKIESMTTAPKGEIDGAVLDEGTVLHWPPHLEDRFREAVKRGDRVTAAGFPRTGPEGDTRLEVRKLTNVDAGVTVQNDEVGPRPKRRKGPPAPATPRRDDATETVRGRIERLTTAPKGEVDGAVLEDGTVLHWPPHMEDRFTEVAKRGDRVEATGFEETTPRGDEHFEVASLTNLRTEASADNDELKGRVEAGPPRRERGKRPAGDDRAERIRDLKRQIERLQREIERVENDR